MTERLITTRGIIFRDGQLFAQQLHNEEGTNDFWSTPGGKLDSAEDIRKSLVRELVEETGITGRVGRLLFVQQFSDGKSREFIEFFFHIENPDDFTDINLSETTHGDLEVAEFGFIDPKKERVMPTFLREVDIQAYIDTVQPVYFSTELREQIS